jgi:hypothetical protein
LALRTTYSQALETLFALLGAAVQAPWCVPAWLVAYRSQDLRNVVQKIDSGKRLPSVIREKHLSWALLAEHLLLWLVIEDKAKESAVKQGFGQLWARFASDFLDRNHIDEYNGIKHGLRVRPGGFHIAIGAEDQPGVRAPRERMQLLGKSDFGSRYLVPRPFGKASHHMRLSQRHRSWNPEGLTWGLHLIAMSISNTLSALKVLNGVPADQVSFQWPTDVSAFAEPWKRTAAAGVISMSGFDVVIPEEFIEPFSKEEILSLYEQGNLGGFRRIVLASQSDADSHGAT